MNKKGFYINSITLFVMNIATILGGFIIPRIIITNYSSETNGLIVSITQFFGYLLLLYGGVGGIVKARLYPEILSNNLSSVSTIYTTTKVFFSKVGYFSVLFAIILSVVFPFLVDASGKVFVGSVVLIIGFQYFIQYFFGITNQIFLSSIGKDYIYSIVQSVTILLNISGVYLLSKNGVQIQYVLLLTNIIYLLRPAILKYYLSKNLLIDYSAKEDKTILKNRWDGMAHTVAYFIHSRIDIFLISIFLTLTEVSIYSIYLMTISGIKIFITTISNSLEPYFGGMRNKTVKEVKKTFINMDILINIVLSVVISVSFVLILPFVMVYSKGFDTSDYVNASIAYLFITGELFYLIRQPYASLIVSFGHYKETRKGAILEAAINVVLSIALLPFFGINGLLFGSMIAMIYRFFDNIIYVSKNIISLEKSYIIKRIFVTLISISLCVFIFSFITINTNNYFEWIKYAILITLSSIALVIVINSLFFGKSLLKLFKN